MATPPVSELQEENLLLIGQEALTSVHKHSGGMSIATVLTLFVVPVFYLTFDWLVRKITGRSSAQGLRRAARVEEEVEAVGKVM